MLQPQVCRQQLLDELAILRSEFERMRAFSASSPECQVRGGGSRGHLPMPRLNGLSERWRTLLRWRSCQEDGKGQERVAHLDFVLKYIAQVVSSVSSCSSGSALQVLLEPDSSPTISLLTTMTYPWHPQVQSVEHASQDQLPQLDLQIKTSLLPLKESLLASASSTSSSVSSSASSASLCSAAEEPLPDSLVGPAQPADDAWMSECSTSAASDSSGEVEGLDDLDFECFSLVMEEDNTKPALTTAGCVSHTDVCHGHLSAFFLARRGLTHPHPCPTRPCVPPLWSNRPAIRCGPLADIDQDDSFTDTASLSSEEPTSPRAADLKRPFDAISDLEARPEEDLLAKRRRYVPPPHTPASYPHTTPHIHRDHLRVRIALLPCPTVPHPRLRCLLCCLSISVSVSSSSVDPSKARPQGPRTVDYQCGQCSEVYKATTALNPWVALEQQECPKCKKIQVGSSSLPSMIRRLSQAYGLTRETRSRQSSFADVLLVAAAPCLRRSLASTSRSPRT